MKNVLIMGASGMVGGECLKYCLDCQDVEKVTAIVRRPTGVMHPKLTEVLHKDFYDFSAVDKYLKNQDVCLYCIGIYTGKVSQDEFYKITVEMTEVFGHAFKKQSPEASFCFLSSEGANEKSLILFARAKGKAENVLQKINFGRLHIFRPGYIYPVVPRVEPNFAYLLAQWLYKPLISKMGNRLSVTSVQLAKAMVRVGISGGEKIFLGNREIVRIK